jgi:hypothetical protein
MACYKIDGGHAIGIANSDDVTRPATVLTCGLSALSTTCLPVTPCSGARLAGATRHSRARAASSGPNFLCLC